MITLLCSFQAPEEGLRHGRDLPAGAAAEVAAEMFASHERGRRCEPVGPDDLGPYATRAIQTWFKEDFENLGYSTDVADWREPPTRRIGP